MQNQIHIPDYSALSMMLFDYVSYKLFSLITLEFESRIDDRGSIHLAIDELQEMPDYNSVVAELESVLGWVSHND